MGLTIVKNNIIDRSLRRRKYCVQKCVSPLARWLRCEDNLVLILLLSKVYSVNSSLLKCSYFGSIVLNIFDFVLCINILNIVSLLYILYYTYLAHFIIMQRTLFFSTFSQPLLHCAVLVSCAASTL